jgi:hypothetical protein
MPFKLKFNRPTVPIYTGHPTDAPAAPSTVQATSSVIMPAQITEVTLPTPTDASITITTTE